MTASTAKMKPSNKSLPRATNAGSMASKDGESLTQSQDIPNGFCQCGCGQRTNVVLYERKARPGRIKGEHYKFVRGHKQWRIGPDYLEEDRGYKTPCWIWQRTTDARGYGGTSADGNRHVKAHRVYYERANGPIPEGFVIDHLCRVPACVNPAHLEPVTNAENVQRGDTAKLTRGQVAEIKARPDETQQALADEYGVHRSAISLIRNGKRWADVKPKEETP